MLYLVQDHVLAAFDMEILAHNVKVNLDAVNTLALITSSNAILTTRKVENRYLDFP